MSTETDLANEMTSKSSGLLGDLIQSIGATLWDVLPIAAVVLFFQLVILRRNISNPGKLIWGMIFVILGLAFFLVGLNLALFPLGEDMARQLTDPEFLNQSDSSNKSWETQSQSWTLFYWTYLFAFLIGVSTTFAEPALIAVTAKAQTISGGTINALGFRIAVSIGVGFGVALGTFRIVMGHSLPAYIIVGYLVVVLLTFFSSKSIIPLAYDSGGVTTSTVTVPLVAALGLGLSSQIPGRSPLLDGFGLIAFASLFPIISVLCYAKITEQFHHFFKQTTNEPDFIE